MSRPVRRSQVIAPFGIGALVDFPGPVSLIHAGLDAWPFDEQNPDHREFRVEDERRLALRLGVDFFVQPPDFRMLQRGETSTGTNLNLKLPFLRFPLWHSCPRCGRMYLARYHDNVAPICRGPIGSGTGKGGDHPPRKTVQVRFVAACKKGHLQDFPWLEWIFKHPNPDWTPDGNQRWLRIRSTGSASLTGVEITAEERDSGGEIRIVERRTLAGAFEGDPASGKPTALGKLGARCSGSNPVLAVGANSGSTSCGHELHPLLRGASNLYFPQVFSSIYIPDIDDSGLSQELLDLLDDHALRSSLLGSAQEADDGVVSVKAAKVALKRFYPAAGVDPQLLADAANKHILKDIILNDRGAREFIIQKIKIAHDQKLSEQIISTVIRNRFPDWEIDPSLLLPSLSAEFSVSQEIEQETGPQDISETDFRRQEYNVFCRDIQDGFPKANLLVKSADIDKYDNVVRSAFERVSLLHKLRETRAFAGFARIFPESGLTQEEQWGLMATERKRWLPAVIVRGEGIFLKFRQDKLDAWIKQHGTVHEGRLSSISHNMDELRLRRQQQPKHVSPKLVLIHTFAHLLINQLVYECGYGSASLKERIYTSEGEHGMSGVLIYTAAGDSEGTMGGLVRTGRPDYLGNIIAKALDNARWCSSDPVCIESRGQGPDNCNLAACHSCSLLPETSCEEQNRLLDRGVVIGTIERPEIGFFSQT